MITCELLPFNHRSSLLAESVKVYCAVWGRNKDESTVFFRNYAQMPDFVGYVALVAHGVVGVAFGTASQSGQWWHDKVVDAVGHSHAAIKNAWVLTELAVLRDYRNRGIGHLLHNRVLSQQPYPNALLSTQVDNTIAKSFYEKHGWTYLHEACVFQKDHPPYCIMHKDMTHAD